MQPEAAKSFLPITWESALEEYVWDSEGRKYIDFTSGIFVANLGHGNLAVRDAWAKEQLVHTYNYATRIREKYTNELCKRTGFECVALFSAGCEAVEAALRVFTSKFKVPSGYYLIYHTPGIFMHGKTRFARLVDDGYRLEEGEMPVKGVAAGVILESYRGWDAHFWDKSWICELRTYCTEHDILLCFDEIQSGFGRTGRFFCYEHYGVTPDLVTVGKAMGNGIPISALLGRKHLLDLPNDLSSTHSGNPLSCAAGLAVLREIEENDLVKEAERKGMILHERLDMGMTRLQRKGRGMVAAIMMPSIEEANRVVTECYKRGLLVVHTGRESVKIGPPLIISDEALNKGLDILEGVLNA